MNRMIISIIAISALVSAAQAQQSFYAAVKIEYEKVTNVPAMYKEMAPEWYEIIKDHLPKSTTAYYDFIGDISHSIFKPGREGEIDFRNGYRPVADKNIVYNDYTKGISISQKPVFEETFLIEDTMQKIKWKLTADSRTIAGFDCRKAIGILDDTIAVFAFYTDELMVTGGPESIHGLPGMILGVGVPRLHTTWFATKVQVANVNLNSVVPATKGKKMDRATMLKSLDKVLRQWGTYGSKLIINFAI